MEIGSIFVLPNSKEMTNINTQIENLTKTQLEDFKVLVRLGDSEELALKTVLEMQPQTESKMYQLAYYN